MWVDSAWNEPGDGGTSTPLKQLPTLTSPLRLHLRSGLYRGPFTFPPGTVVEGHGQVVLFLDVPGTVIARADRLTLKNVIVQGGTVGLEGAGPLVLDHVEVSGQREAMVRVSDGGVTATALTLATRIEGTTGLDAYRSVVKLEQVRLTGPHRQGVRLTDCSSTVSELTAEGAATALQVRGGEVVVRTLRTGAGVGPAVTSTNARAHLSDLDVTGHEYAVLVSGGTVVIERLIARSPSSAGVSIVEATATLKEVTIDHAGSLGGVQLLNSRSTVGRLTVTQSPFAALFVRQGTAVIDRLEARGLEGEADQPGVGGDVLHVRDAKVEVRTLEASACAGAGVLASNNAVVKLERVDTSDMGVGAIVVERKSTVEAGRVRALGNRGPALAAPEGGTLRVGHLMASGPDVAVWADCDSGSRVHVEAVDERTTLPGLSCLTFGSSH